MILIGFKSILWELILIGFQIRFKVIVQFTEKYHQSTAEYNMSTASSRRRLYKTIEFHTKRVDASSLFTIFYTDKKNLFVVVLVFFTSEKIYKLYFPLSQFPCAKDFLYCVEKYIYALNFTMDIFIFTKNIFREIKQGFFADHTTCQNCILHLWKYVMT